MVSKRDMQAFENVRQSGVTNMFARDVVCKLAGISKKTYMEIIEGDNYSKYMKKYGIKRV